MKFSISMGADRGCRKTVEAADEAQARDMYVQYYGFKSHEQYTRNAFLRPLNVKVIA